MSLKPFVTAALCAATLTACAKASGNIEARPVSTSIYEKLTCEQLSEEAQRVATEANTVAGVQDKNAKRDAVVTGVAAVVFWPAAFFIRGNKENAAVLAQLKGELEAIKTVSEAKDCGIAFRVEDTVGSAAPN